MTKEEKAVELKHSGYNCCQAVLLSFAEEIGADEEFLCHLGAGFGMGMGCMESDCGALVGAVMVDGLVNNRRNAANARKLRSSFREKCGAVCCGDLKGISTGTVLCPCDDCIRNAIRCLEE